MSTDFFLYKGDNKEVLKKKEIKPNLIYMDPPYNTWNETLTYYDKDTSSNWRKNFENLIKEIKKQAEINSTYFISIGTEELANVILTLEKILGKKSIIAIMPRRTHSGHKTSKTISLQHDFVVVAKTGVVNFNGVELDTKSYKNKDKHFKERGLYQLRRVDYKDFKWSESLDCEIKLRDNVFYPGGVSKNKWIQRKKNHSLKDWAWIWSKEKIKFAYENDFLIVKDGKLYKKTYTKALIKRIEKGKYEIEILKRTKNMDSLHLTQKEYSLKKSKTKPESLFDYPKSDKLITDLISLPKNKKKIILDPFGGTGTTAISAWEINADEVHIIQRSEKTIENSQAHKDGFKDVYDLTKANIEQRTKIKIKEINIK